MKRLFNLRSLFGIQSSRRQPAAKHSGPESLEVRTLMSINSLVVSQNLTADAPGATTRIINGTVTNQYASVGKVGDASDFYGSGTLIAPQYVLTAGHCAEGVADTAGRFMINGVTYRTTKVYMHPNYNINQLGNDAANDIAIFKLETPVTGVTPSPIYRSSPSVGQLLTLVGYGYGGTGTSGSDGIYGTKRVGTTPIDSVTPRLITWDFTSNSESNTAPGDSGGPAFVTVGGVQYVAGVTSGGNQDNAGLGDQSFDTRVDAYATWIDSIVGTTPTNTVTVGIRAADANAAETATGQAANPGQFIVTRTGSTTSPLTVSLKLSGSATNGTDYNSIPTTIIIPAGATSATINVAVKDDALVEGTENVIVAVSAGTGYSIDAAATSATVAIADNDAVRWNDLFANRQVLSGTTVSTTGTNVNATKQTGEQNIAGVSGGKSVWWSWTATASGTVTISTAGSAFDTTLGVYRGTAVNGLTRVVVNDDENTNSGIYTSKVTFNAVAGTTYQIAVDGYQGDSGAVRLSLVQTVGKSTNQKSEGKVNLANRDSASTLTTSDRNANRATRRESVAVRRQAAVDRRTIRHQSFTASTNSQPQAIDMVFCEGVGLILDSAV